jgi:DNA invertase Pin-like site-specific DNA recombinase
VSTDRQGRSGLGLDAQREAVRQFLAVRPASVITEYTEIESGSKNDRPQLAFALDACRKHRATLLLAKLDRLGRNVAFISALMESDVEFTAADNPHASKLMLHLLAAFAEHEREMIAQRTKAALAAAKARGVRLGANGAVLAERHKAEATEYARQIAPAISAARQTGARTARQIAEYLNAMGVPSRQGGHWHPANVNRAIRRM